MSNKSCVRGEAAVSPVIGTILLVAIVVVLAAVIGVVALGLTPQSEAKVVGIVAKENSTGAGMEILLTGGRDVSQLKGLRVSGDAGSVELNETPVGASLNVPNASTLLSSSPGLVTITGIFEDGTEQMIWQGKLGLAMPTPTPTPDPNPFTLTLTSNSPNGVITIQNWALEEMVKENKGSSPVKIDIGFRVGNNPTPSIWSTEITYPGNGGFTLKGGNLVKGQTYTAEVVVLPYTGLNAKVWTIPFTYN